MIVCPILSGSSGNATYIESGSTRVLVDAGGTGSAIEENLKKIGVDPRTLTCLLATHAHSDHIRGLGVLSRRYKLPIYASEGVWKQIDKGRVGCIAACCMKRFCSVSKRRARPWRYRSDLLFYSARLVRFCRLRLERRRLLLRNRNGFRTRYSLYPRENEGMRRRLAGSELRLRYAHGRSVSLSFERTDYGAGRAP